MKMIDPVFLCNNLGKKDITTGDTSNENRNSDDGGNMSTSMSIKEAVKIAQSNNLMGLVCRSELLVCFFFSPSTYLCELRNINGYAPQQPPLQWSHRRRSYDEDRYSIADLIPFQWKIGNGPSFNRINSSSGIGIGC